MDSPRWSRRKFLHTAVATGAVSVLPSVEAKLLEQQAAQPNAIASGGEQVYRQKVLLTINGKKQTVDVDTRTTVLDLVREDLAMPGTKKGCDHGQCGACTVLVNGRRVNSCMTLAVMHAGDEITTVEGLGSGDQLHPMQAAFVEHDAFRCGYCTPGQIVSAVGLLKEPCGLSDDDVRECMSGNICRCGAYPNIVAAVKAVRGKA